MKEECSKQGQASANALWQDGLGQPTREQRLDLREKEGMRSERCKRPTFFASWVIKQAPDFTVR